MSVNVISWWYFLCAVGTLNVVAWAVSKAALARRAAAMGSEAYAARRLQLLFSGLYVAGCAFRSFFPVYDVPRIGVVDSWLSSVLVGRSVATVAELCFVAQWALMMREIALAHGSALGLKVSRALVPMIAIAETCSWYSVLTTSNLGHTAEESLWGLSALLLVASVAVIWPQSSGARRPGLLFAMVGGTGYVGYMFFVDVPMYWARWVADEASGRHYLGVAQGLVDVATRRIVSHRAEDWRHEVIWMSLYFSVAVWISLSLIHVPAMERLTSVGRRRSAPALVGVAEHL